MAEAQFEVGGTIVRLTGDRFVVGRGADCDVALPVDLVSRHHAEVRWDAGRWTVRDLDSANSTFLNRRRIDVADLRVGDIVRLGEGGPKIKVIALDPAPVDEDLDDDLQATRVVRVKAPRGRATQPRRPQARTPPPEPAAPEMAADRAPVPWLGVVGACFGASLALAWWPDAFPYEVVAAPGLWASRALAAWQPDFFVPRLGVVLLIVLGFYWAAVGVCVQRVRTFPLLILFAGVHAVAALSL